MTKLSVLPLVCPVQQYGWGKLGSASTVAQLAKSSGQEISESKPYAELWMGTHPSAPSTLQLSTASEPVKLESYLSEPLPFLFKVLSVATALSIQAHPNKTHAAQLHLQNPKEYKDDNHKPELACALTPFSVMCGFRPVEQILHYCQTVDELRHCIGQQQVDKLKAAHEKRDDQHCKTALREAYTHLMSCDSAKLRQQLELLLKRTQQPIDDKCPSANSTLKNLPVYSLIQTLHSQYPYDIGIFSPFLLNCFTLSVGESIFLPPNEPHAYLSGDCVEVMACSDNVVRAGLTPKFKDVDVLCEMLTYKTELPTVKLGEKLDSQTIVYRAPVPEFILFKIAIEATEPHYQVKSLPAHSILIVTQGSGTLKTSDKTQTLVKGSIYLIPANESVSIHCNSDCKEQLQIFQCAENFEFKQSK